ncbi:MAG: hypothetical protein MUO72_09570 [Bacteroidales bacterium]|nr:hypothetical protein [Bacteroidales bacterium]
MKRWGKQKPVHFDEKELKTDLGSGNFIFVGSSCDMFAKNIPDEWINKTMEHCRKLDNTYLFQSKNPQRFMYVIFPPKTKLCTTIETNRWYPGFMNDSPIPTYRSLGLSGYIGDKYITIEPIMDFDLQDLVYMIKKCNPIQVNIGADSGNNNLPEPSKKKILALIDELKKFTVIDQKRNLKRLL